jgi:hypothetical protein
MGKCENCGNDREEYLNHYCKKCLDKLLEDDKSKTIAKKDNVIERLRQIESYTTNYKSMAGDRYIISKDDLHWLIEQVNKTI